tara:strand:+ start:237 stop:491 length:255 start_codon:yes stop_codon:yes gene_type:complete
MTNKYAMKPNVYKRKLDKYDPGIPMKFLTWLLLLVKKELSSMLKLAKDNDKVMEIKKKKMPYKYLKIVFNLSLKAIGKNLLFII